MVTSFADIRLASLLASVVRRPFCFWVRGPELRLWGFGHWVPQLIFLSGLEIPPGAVDRGTPLEESPSSSTPDWTEQRRPRKHERDEQVGDQKRAEALQQLQGAKGNQVDQSSYSSAAEAGQQSQSGL